MRIQLNLSLLPDDILLAILAFGTLADVLTSPLICRAFNALARKRSPWIHALNAERLQRPIAYPAYTDLTALSLADLKRIARHTYRLSRNWTIEHPNDPLPIAGAIKAVVLSAPRQEEGADGDVMVGLLDLIFQVPGTEYYVLHSRMTGELVVWDVDSARQVTRGLYVAQRITDVSAGQQAEGRFWMGLLVADSVSFLRNKVLIVCLEYGTPAGPSLTVTFEYVFKPNLSHWAIFMTKEYIGALESTQDLDGYIHIVAVNIATRRHTLITTDNFRQDLALGGAHSGTSTVDDDTFILLEDSESSYIFSIPRAILPHDANPNVAPTATLTCRGPATATWELGPLSTSTPEGALSANDSYGVPAVSLHSITKEHWNINVGARIEHNMEIRFWAPSGRLPNSSEGVATPSLIPKWIANVPGMLQDSPDSAWKLMLLSHSGRTVLLVMDLGTRLELRLVAVDPELDRLAVNSLALPPFIELRFVYGLSIDDHRGVITLLDMRGLLFAIPYA